MPDRAQRPPAAAPASARGGYAGAAAIPASQRIRRGRTIWPPERRSPGADDQNAWVRILLCRPLDPIPWMGLPVLLRWRTPVSYTHLRAHETDSYLVCRLLLEKK